MQMTEYEICQSYREALNKTKQISILAELNACEKKAIIEIIHRNGDMVPGEKSMNKKAAVPDKTKVVKNTINKTVESILINKLYEIEAEIKEIECQKKKLEEQYTDIAVFLGTKGVKDGIPEEGRQDSHC